MIEMLKREKATAVALDEKPRRGKKIPALRDVGTRYLVFSEHFMVPLRHKDIPAEWWPVLEANVAQAWKVQSYIPQWRDRFIPPASQQKKVRLRSDQKVADGIRLVNFRAFGQVWSVPRDQYRLVRKVYGKVRAYFAPAVTTHTLDGRSETKIGPLVFRRGRKTVGLVMPMMFAR